MRLRGNVLVTLSLSLLLINSCGQEKSNDDSKILVWETVNKKWDKTAENEFSVWIEKLGTARAEKKCIKLADCLKLPSANSLYNEDDKQLNVYADCADVPVILRAYFAYKTKRPYQYVSAISGSQYSKDNYPTNWSNQNKTPSVKSLFSNLANSVHSGFYRTAPTVENTDTYPIDINVKSVQPGTVFYDPNGHLLLVYKVEKNGIVRFMDGHPDNSLTVQTFGEKFARGGSPQGGGFRNWRKYEENANGSITRTKNADSEHFSGTAQYKSVYSLGTDGNGDYYKWIRYKLSQGNTSIKPEEEMRDKLTQLCIDIKDRENAINNAIISDIDKKIHPTELPKNIYGTDGEWETYSTPSRDARLKASIREIYSFVNESVTWLEKADKRLIYSGNKSQLLNLYKSLWLEYSNKKECKVSYTNSIKTSVSLNLTTVINRIYDLSFDPYNCPELRWGAKIGQAEYSSCPRDTNKESWYNKEYRLRNAIERQYGEPTPLTYGPEIGQDINVPNLLNKLSNSSSDFNTTPITTPVPTPIPTPIPTPVPTPVPTPIFNNCTETKITYSYSDGANIRTGPSISAAIITTLYYNDKLYKCNEIVNKWSKIKLVDGTTGWVYKSFIE